MYPRWERGSRVLRKHICFFITVIAMSSSISLCRCACHCFAVLLGAMQEAVSLSTALSNQSPSNNPDKYPKDESPTLSLSLSQLRQMLAQLETPILHTWTRSAAIKPLSPNHRHHHFYKCQSCKYMWAYSMPAATTPLPLLLPLLLLLFLLLLLLLLLWPVFPLAFVGRLEVVRRGELKALVRNRAHNLQLVGESRVHSLLAQRIWVHARVNDLAGHFFRVLVRCVHAFWVATSDSFENPWPEVQ